MKFKIQTTNDLHLPFAAKICELIEEAAKTRGTGIAKREVSYLEEKIASGKAVIAFYEDDVAGFCYIETWEHGKYVANSGLIISPKYRKMGLAKMVKKHAFNLARNKYPDAKVFGITTGLAVMKINTQLGYHPVTFSELTQDNTFWKGCQSCKNYDILERNNRKMCLCTAMLAPSKNEVMKYDLTSLVIEKK